MWFNRKAEETLKPGPCECGHNRSSHYRGQYACHVAISAKEMGRTEVPAGTMYICACQLYIRASGGGGPEVEPIDPEVEELKKIAGVK